MNHKAFLLCLLMLQTCSIVHGADRDKNQQNNNASVGTSSELLFSDVTSTNQAPVLRSPSDAIINVSDDDSLDSDLTPRKQIQKSRLITPEQEQALFEKIEADRVRKYAEEKVPRSIDTQQAPPSFPSLTQFQRSDPGSITEITKLTARDVQQIQKLLLSKDYARKGGSSSIETIFPSDYQDWENGEIADYLSQFSRFIVARDQNNQIVSLLIFSALDEKSMAIKVFIADQGASDQQSMYHLHQRLEEICRAKEGCESIVVVPTSGYDRALFCSRHGYHFDKDSSVFVKKLNPQHPGS